LSAKALHEGAVLVVGLGRFGSALAEGLQRLGHEVLAVDMSTELVQEYSDRLTHVAQVDATSPAAMRQIGAHEFDIAVVAIGTGIEASLLSTGVLIDLGVREIWAKAITTAHGRLLERLGAGHVVYPERDTGQRVAHLLSGRLMDYIEFDDGYAIVKMRARDRPGTRPCKRPRYAPSTASPSSA
jgi:trk system potassium uptake protein TrkA